MSIAGYLVPNRPRVGRAKSGEAPLVKGAEGEVLSGRKMPEEIRYDEAVKTATEVKLEGTPMAGGLKRSGYEGSVCESVTDYDPVLLAHCGLGNTPKK